MNFSNEKVQALRKANLMDKSRKGDIDKEILGLVNLINSHPDYYTTSSCAGRIQLLLPSGTGKKYDTGWLFSSHSTVTAEEIEKALAGAGSDSVWFKIEAPILHICARDLECAYRLMKLANDSGLRRSSIISISRRIICELFFPEKIECPVSDVGRMLVDGNYIRVLISYANKKLVSTRKKLKRFEKKFTSLPIWQPI